MEQPRYIETSPAVRAKLVGSAAAVILVGVAFDYWVEPLLQWIASLPTCESLPWVRSELLIAVAVAWYVGTVAFKQARKTWKLQQTPLPETWVWSRTRVRAGTYATTAAIALYAMAVLFLFGPPVLVAWQQLYLIFCVPQACGC